MVKKQQKEIAVISRIAINGLKGRVLYVPAKKKHKKEILAVYGHHASIERMKGIAEALSEYGNVTVPDIPGFGGMDSFFSIAKKPTIDNLADYLAAFIKLRYKHQKITILGISLGFVVATRMLQKYPELTNKVSLLVSAAGFVHKDDFAFSRTGKAVVAQCARLLSTRPLSFFIKYTTLRKPMIKLAYSLSKSKAATTEETDDERRQRIAFEVELWQKNDIRTHMFTLYEMLTLDLCGSSVHCKVYHVPVVGDQYLDNQLIEQHLRVIYDSYESIPLKAKVHAPTVIADARTAKAFLPRKLRNLLST